MKLTIVVHDAEEGGYWAEVPAITGCVSQGDSLDELLKNVREAVEGCLSVDVWTSRSRTLTESWRSLFEDRKRQGFLRTA